MSGAAWAGLAVTSHDASQTAAATFDHVTVSASALPAEWNETDVGSAGLPGSAVFADGAFTVKGSGADIWGSADAFHFVHQPLSGNGQLTARVVSVQNTHRWAKAGVMVRSSLAPDAAHAFMLVSAAAGRALQARTANGALSVNYAAGAGGAPYWVRIVRSGSTLSGYESADGATWTLVRSLSVPLGATVQIGLAVTSHDDTQLATAKFDHVLKQ